MAIDNINDYAGMWANGVNIGELWDKIKAKFVAGFPGESGGDPAIDQSSYSNPWKLQARTNIGLPNLGVDALYIGIADSKVSSLILSTVGKAVLQTTGASAVNNLWAAKASNAVGDADGNAIKTSYASSLSINTDNNQTNLYLKSKDSTTLSTIPINRESGLARLDGNKLPLTIFPDAILGQVLYGGTAAPVSGQSYLDVTSSMTPNAKSQIANRLSIPVSDLTGKTLRLRNAETTDISGSVYSFGWSDTVGIYFIMEGSSNFASLDLNVGDWLISTGEAWKKVDNTDAVTSVSGVRDSYITPTPASTGQVVMSAQRVGALDLYSPNTEQTVQGNVHFNKNVGADWGMSANGIVDLSASVGGGGGGTVTAIKISSVGTELAPSGGLITIPADDATAHSSSSRTNGTIKLGGVEIAVHGLNSLAYASTVALSSVTGADDLKAIEALTATSGYLKKTAANTWALATDVVTLAGQQALTNKTYNGYTLAAACAKGVVDNSSATALGSSGTNLVTERSVYYGLPTINGGHSYNSGTTLFAPTSVGSNGQILKSGGSGAPSWVNQSSLVAGKATQLETTRKIWGQDFNGTGDVDGKLTITYDGTSNAELLSLKATNSSYACIQYQKIGTNGIIWAAGVTEYNYYIWNQELQGHALTILNNGRVGIGNTNPSVKLDVNGYIKGTQLNLTQTTGTAPMTVASTTKVDNLNADLLDGKHWTEFVQTLGTNGDKLTWKKGDLWDQTGLTVPYASTTSRFKSDSTFTNQEFVYRQSPQTIDADSFFINKIKGKTLTWNQNHKMSTALFNTWSGSGAQVSSSKTGNSVTLTVTSAGIYSFYTMVERGFIPDGHKVYAAASIKPSVEIQQGSIRIGRGNNYAQPTVTLSANVFNRISFIQAINNASVASDTTSYFVFERGGTQQQLAVGTTIEITDLIIVDLTRMFGAGHEPSTTADFEKMFPLGYYPYNGGEIINNDADGMETERVNLWDEEWEVGQINDSGNNANSSSRIRSKNFIPVISGSTYYFTMPTAAYTVRLYDSGKNFLGTGSVSSNTLTIPSGVSYIRFFVGSSAYSLQTYNNDICINLSDTERNGTYEPYKKDILGLHLKNIQVKSPNIWDEEYLVGVYDQSDGETFSPNVGYLCSANKIPVVDGGSYYFKSPYNLRLYFYDHNKKYLYTTTMNRDAVYPIPDGVCYIRIQMAYSGTYANDICINANGVNNGKYFPSGILTINGINSTPNGTCDEISGNKLIKRTGRKKLKDLSWSLLSNNRYVAVIYGSKHPYFSFFDSSKYTFTSSPYSGDPDMTIWSEDLTAQPNDGVLRIRDSEIGSGTALQNSFTDEEVVYELGQYEEYELVSPIPDTMPAGTTERIISDRLPVTPFACDMTYGANPKDILASGIPWERIWNRPILAKGLYSDATLTPAISTDDQNNTAWFKLPIGDTALYIKFAVGDKAFKLQVADDDVNPTVSKEFEFATLSTADINAICV